jgi:hypothetical protein
MHVFELEIKKEMSLLSISLELVGLPRTVRSERRRKEKKRSRSTERIKLHLFNSCMHASWSPSRYIIHARIDRSRVGPANSGGEKKNKEASDRTAERKGGARERPKEKEAGWAKLHRPARARLAGRGALHPSIFYFLFNSDSALDLYKNTTGC